MIFKGGTFPMLGRYRLLINGKWAVVQEVYRGDKLVWQNGSCYGRGIWIPNKKWVDNDIWKNNG